MAKVQTKYLARPEGPTSKSSTWRDRGRILGTIVTLFRIERPVLFFGSIAALLLATPLAITYTATGLVPRLPTAVLATGLSIVACLCFFTGLILDTVVRGSREMRRLAYLALPARAVAIGRLSP